MKKINRQFYYRREIWKGCIPNDKVRIGDEPYENGWWNEIIGTKLEKHYLNLKYDNKNEFNLLLKVIDVKIEMFLEKKTMELEYPETKPFYLNFNHDGIDCFVHRWNLKYKK